MPRHKGYTDSVNLTISLCLTYTLCLACVRLWIRKGAFGVDDIVIAIATLISFGHTGADYAALANGLGTSWDRIVDFERLTSLDAASIAGVVTFVIALYLSKCAMIAFLSWITKTHSQLMLYHVCNSVMAVLGVISVLVVTVDCPSDSGYYWAFYDNALLSCPSRSARWQALTALDIITEIILLVLPVHLILGLQMPLSRKAMIIAAFYLQLPVIGFAIGRNYYTLRLRLASTDAGLTSGVVVIWLEVQLAYALAASTLSASKSFTASFSSGFGLGFARGKGEDAYGLSNMSGKFPNASKDEKSRNDSGLESGIGLSGPRHLSLDFGGKHHMDYGGSSIMPIPPPSAITYGDLKLRPETGVKHSTHVSAERDLGPWPDTSSNESQKSADDMFIVRETAYEVQHDRAPTRGWTAYG